MTPYILGGRLLVLLTVSLASLLAAPVAHTQEIGGILAEQHGDRFGAPPISTGYVLASRDGEQPLADAQPRGLVGQRVRLNDANRSTPELDGRVRADGEQRIIATPAAGPRSLLVILLTFPDAPTASATADEARRAVFTAGDSASALFQQQSEGATRFVGKARAEGDIAGPLRLSMTLDGCRYDDIAVAAAIAARAAGWVPDAYDHVIYALPSNAKCGWGGLGDLPGRRTWVNGRLSTGVIAHELGHNLGAHHANSMACSGPGGAPAMFSASCSSSEYGDPFDVMGGGLRLMSSWHRAQIGQLPLGQATELRQSSTVALSSSDTFGAPGTRLLLVPRKEPRQAVESYFAIETRSNAGPFDLWPDGSSVTSGLSVRIVPALASSLQSQLLDARPATATPADAPLPIGETLRDDAHNIVIRAEAAGGGQLRAVVTLPTLVDDVAPTPPRNVAASGDTARVRLVWAAASDDDAIDHYEIERDGAIIASTPSLVFDDERVAEITRAAYRVIAVDRSANRTASTVVNVTLGDVTAPSSVPGLRASVDGATVTVAWGAAQDNRGVRAYRVVRSGVSLGETTAGSLRDTPTSGSYRYEVRAVDAAGNVGPIATVDASVSTTTRADDRVPATTVDPFLDDPSDDNVSSAPARTPRIRLVGYRWTTTRRGRVITMRFSAPGATSMRAYRSGRKIARARGSRLTVRLRMPRRAQRRAVRIVASSPDGSTVESWSVR